MNPKQHLKYTITDRITGEIICSCGCGLVIQDNLIDLSHPDTTDSIKTKIHHIQELQDFHNNGLGTKISTLNFDHEGRPISNMQREFTKKLRNVEPFAQDRNMSGRRLFKYFTTLKKLESQLQLSDSIIGQIRLYVRRAESLRLLENKNTLTVIGVLTYLIKKLNKIPVNPRTLKKQLGFSWRSYNNYLAEFQTHLKIKSELLITGAYPAFELISNKMQLEPKIKTLAKTVMDYCKKKGLFSSKSPSVFAATCIHIASINTENSPHSMVSISEYAEISPQAIRNLKRDMVDVLAVLRLSSEMKIRIVNYRNIQNV